MNWPARFGFVPWLLWWTLYIGTMIVWLPLYLLACWLRSVGSRIYSLYLEDRMRLNGKVPLRYQMDDGTWRVAEARERTQEPQP